MTAVGGAFAMGARQRSFYAKTALVDPPWNRGAGSMPRRARIVSLAAVAFLAGCPPRPQAPLDQAARGAVVVEDFEDFVWGGHWVTAEFTRGADPRMQRVTEPVHGGRNACRLTVQPGEHLVLKPGAAFATSGDQGAQGLALPGEAERVGIWVRGEESGHQITFRLRDAQGKRANVSLRPVDFAGWTFLDAPLPKLAPPVRLQHIRVAGGRGPLVVDDLAVRTAAKPPVYVQARALEAERDFVADRPVRMRVVVQCVAENGVGGRGEVAVFPANDSGEPVERRRFSYRAVPDAPSESRLSFDLPAGAYRVVARAAGVESRLELVVHPVPDPPPQPDALAAARAFPGRRDSLVVYHSAFSPAVLVESRERTLTLFRGMGTLGLTAPRQAFLRHGEDVDPAEAARKDAGTHPPATQGAAEPNRASPGDEETEAERATKPVVPNEPWLLVWFGESPAWTRVKLADGTPCPTFDVPFLVVCQRRPTNVRLDGRGLHLTYPRRAGRVAVMPLYGIGRPRPATTARWKSRPELIEPLVAWCRAWARSLLAFPVGLREQWRPVPGRDAIEVRLQYDYLVSDPEWPEPPTRVAPVPPLLMLARQAGLPVRFSRTPRDTGCLSSVGPWFVVPDADSFTYTIEGLSQCVTSVLADLPADGRTTGAGRAIRVGQPLASVGRIPFWAGRLDGTGRGATEALLGPLLWSGNRVARKTAAEHLRGAWYAGFHAGDWPALRQRRHRIRALYTALAPQADWATLGLGAEDGPLDPRLNAAVYYARLAARLGKGEEFADAYFGAVKLLVTAYALTAGAPTYAADHAPWPSLAGLGGKATALTRCQGDSLGLSPGPPALVTQPSDAGYCLASRFLAAYVQEKFRPGPSAIFGTDPAAWKERAFVEWDVPDLGQSFRPAPRRDGGFPGNYVAAVRPGHDGWPGLLWTSHRAPSGAPLMFGTIGTAPATRGKLVRSRDVGSHLRLAAYRAIAAPPPPRETESPTPPGQEESPAESGGDTPDQSPPRNTPDSAPGTGAPAK
jgi:hypothetical protein